MMNYLVRASSLEGIHATITSLGGDADEILRREGVETGDLDPQAWFSYYRFLLLLEAAARAMQCPHFGLLLASHQGINVLGPVGFVIQQAPDVHSALHALTVHFSHHNQGAEVELRVEKGIAQWRFHCKLQGRVPLRQQEDLAAGVGLNLMRLLWNSNWSPDAVYLPHAPPADQHPYRRAFKCPLIFKLAVGKRTLQRQLKTYNTSYKNLLQEVRFEIAKRHLRESSGSLTALAEMLCYSDLGTFSTAFRRHQGVSPGAWRRQSDADAAYPAWALQL